MRNQNQHTLYIPPVNSKTLIFNMNKEKVLILSIFLTFIISNRLIGQSVGSSGCTKTSTVYPVFLYPHFETFQGSYAPDASGTINFDNLSPSPKSIFFAKYGMVKTLGNDVLRENGDGHWLKDQDCQYALKKSKYKVAGYNITDPADCQAWCTYLNRNSIGDLDTIYRSFDKSSPRLIYWNVLVQDSIKLWGSYNHQVSINNGYPSELSSFEALNSHLTYLGIPCGKNNATTSPMYSYKIHDTKYLEGDTFLSTGTHFEVDSIVNPTISNNSKFLLSQSYFFISKGSTFGGIALRDSFIKRGFLRDNNAIYNKRNSIVIGKQLLLEKKLINIAGFYKKQKIYASQSYVDERMITKKGIRSGFFLVGLNRHLDSVYSYAYDTKDTNDFIINTYQKDFSGNHHLFGNITDLTLVNNQKQYIGYAKIMNNGAPLNSLKFSFIDNRPLKVIKMIRMTSNYALLCQSTYGSSLDFVNYLMILDTNMNFIKAISYKGISGEKIKINDILYKNNFIYLGGTSFAGSQNPCLFRVNIGNLQTIDWYRKYIPKQGGSEIYTLTDAGAYIVAFGRYSTCSIDGHFTITIEPNIGTSRCNFSIVDIVKIKSVSRNIYLTTNNYIPINIDSSNYFVLNYKNWDIVNSRDSGIQLKDSLPTTCRSIVNSDCNYSACEQYPYQSVQFSENLCAPCCTRTANYQGNSWTFCLGDTAESKHILSWPTGFRTYTWKTFQQYPYPKGREVYNKNMPISNPEDTLRFIGKTYDVNPKYTINDQKQGYFLVSSARDSFCEVTQRQDLIVNEPIFQICDSMSVSDSISGIHHLSIKWISRGRFAYSFKWEIEGSMIGNISERITVLESTYKALEKKSIKVRFSILPTGLSSCDRLCLTEDNYILCLRTIYGSCCNCK